MNFPVKSCRHNILKLPSIVAVRCTKTVCCDSLSSRVNSNCKRAGKNGYEMRSYIEIYLRAKNSHEFWDMHSTPCALHTQKPMYASLNIWIGMYILRVLYKFKILFLHDNIFRCEIANRTFFPTWLLVHYVAVPHSVFRRKLLSLIVHLVRLKIN